MGIADLQAFGANILDMRTEPVLHDAVRDLYTAITLTFLHTNAYKIVENCNGEALIGHLGINVQSQAQQQLPATASPVSPAHPHVPNRRERTRAVKKKR